MKRIFSFLLAVMLLVSALPVAYAADVDYTQGTAVSFDAEADNDGDGVADSVIEYTITVPAKLAPGASGTVTLSGTWPSNATVKVTSDTSVELVNSINEADRKTLDVTFPGIEKAGDNTEAKTYTETVSVSNIEKAIFGTWNGHFNYNVDLNIALLPGLYETGSNYTVLLKDWDTLISEGIITEDGQSVYANRKMLAGDLVVSDTVTELPGQAYQGAVMTSIYLPSSITSVCGDSFWDAWALEKIVVDEENPSYCSVDGILYNKNMDTLVYRPENHPDIDEFIVPEGITTIADQAVMQSYSLKSITIPEGVTSIGYCAFHSCHAFTSIELPASLTSIGAMAFWDCNAMTEIKFNGTMAQWNAIELGDRWNNVVPAKEIICSDGTVTLS